ncbi:cysteine hydrolase family protein [Kitasatospora sp. NPDC059673]|uniref:cysteine hydrolase family protein n=1 Tax=Kitasatospora sp. NPDC059673 TaxID=3346901 RepID=UPI003686F8F4
MKNTALLLLDCQSAVLSALPEAGPLLDRLERAAAEVRARGGAVAHVRVAFTEDDWAAVPAANATFAAVARHRALHHQDPAADFHPRLAPQEGDLVARKTRLGALSTTDLDRRLRGRGIDTLIVGGLSTGGAVLSTVLHAADRDYRLRVLSDGIADPDPEVHAFVLHRLLPSRAQLVTCAGLFTP